MGPKYCDNNDEQTITPKIDAPWNNTTMWQQND